MVGPLQARPNSDKALSAIQSSPQQGMEQTIGRGGGEGNPETIGGELPGSEQATPEEQDALERSLSAVQAIMFESEESKQGIIDSLRAGSDNPAQAIGGVVRSLVGLVDEQSNGTIPETVILPLATSVLDEVVNLSEAHPELPTPDQNIMGAAGQIAVQGLAEDYGVDPSEVESLLNEIPQEQLAGIQQEQSRYG